MKRAFQTLTILVLFCIAYVPSVFAEVGSNAGLLSTAAPGHAPGVALDASSADVTAPDFTFEEWEERIGQYASAGQMACQNGTLNMIIDGALRMYQYFGAILVERAVSTRWPWLTPFVSATLRYLVPLIASEARWLCRCVPVVTSTETVMYDPDGNIVLRKELTTRANCCVVLPIPLNFLGLTHCEMPIQTQTDCIRRAESGAATCF